MSGGEAAFSGFGDLKQAQAKVAGDEADERLDARGFAGAENDLAQRFQALRLLQGEEILPAGECIVVSGGDGQGAAVAEVTAALAEGSGEFAAHDAGIEGVASERDAARGEDGEGDGFTGVAVRDAVAAQDADIEGAAAKIEDEEGLRAVLREIGTVGVGIGSGDGLVGEMDAFEAGQEGGLQHAGLGEGVLRGVFGITDRAAEDDFGELSIQGGFGAAAGDVEIKGDDVFEEVEIFGDGRAEVGLRREAALETEEESSGREDIALDVDIAQEGRQLGEGELDFADVDALELDGAVEVLLVVAADGFLTEVELAVVREVEGGAGDGGVGGGRV